jgi:pentatricopeptide repeat protein
VRVAGEVWSTLEDKKLLKFLTRSQLDAYATMLARLCPVGQPNVDWPQEDRVVIERIALAIANGRAPEALTACMIAYLLRGEYDAVIRLHRDFLSTSEESLSTPTSADNDTGDLEESGDGLISITDNSPRTDRGTALTTLAAIAAHAMQNNFAEAWQASDKTRLRRTHFTTMEFLRSLSANPTVHTTVERYIRYIEIAGLVCRPGALSKQIDNLVNDRAISQLEKLYTSIVEGVSGERPYLAVDPAHVTPDQPVFVSEGGWSLFLRAFIELGQRQVASRVWDDMVRVGITPGSLSWAALLSGYDKSGHLQSAINAWGMMIAANVQPDAIVYVAMIKALFRAGKITEALDKFREFDGLYQKGKALGVHVPPIAVYNAALDGLFTVSRTEEAEMIVKDMQNRGPPLDIVTYNIIIQFQARRGQFRKVATTLRDLRAAGLSGDVFTFSSILSALLKAGRKDAVEITNDLLKSEGITANVATYSAVIDSLMRENDEQSLKGALDWLTKMEQNPYAQPNDVTYTTVLAGIYRASWLDKHFKDECLANIRERMRKRGVRPNRATYHILIRASLGNHTQQGLQDALILYREMQKRVGLENDSWYVMLHGLVERGEWGAAKEVAGDLRRSGLQPKGNVMEVIRRIDQHGLAFMGADAGAAYRAASLARWKK